VSKLFSNVVLVNLMLMSVHAETHNGSGRHIWDVPLDDYVLYTKVSDGSSRKAQLASVFCKIGNN
jgi:hypothetical protein